jgi:nucleotide-binding universal stress UspA family protein
MSSQQRAILICLSGLDTEEFIARAAPHLPRERRLVLLYVIDTRPAEEMGYIARRLQVGSGMSHHQQDIMSAADTGTAEAVLSEGAASCAALGFDAALISKEVRKGRPEQEIIEIGRRPDLDIGLVVIGSSYKRGGHPSVGPASVGHVARFVVDHSPCDVLVLR